jgi:hypothetical protein
MPTFSRWIAYSSLAVLVALYVVGAVSHGSLRHEVQTLPLWFPIVWGFRHRELAKWSALPCFMIWLAIMIAIWLFLLGWARILTGHFSPVEIAMTLIVGAVVYAELVQVFAGKPPHTRRLLMAWRPYSPLSRYWPCGLV